MIIFIYYKEHLLHCYSLNMIFNQFNTNILYLFFLSQVDINKYKELCFLRFKREKGFYFVYDEIHKIQMLAKLLF